MHVRRSGRGDNFLNFSAWPSSSMYRRATSHTNTVLLQKRTRSSATAFGAKQRSYANNVNAHSYVSDNRTFNQLRIFGVPLARLVRYQNIKRIQRH